MRAAQCAISSRDRLRHRGLYGSAARKAITARKKLHQADFPRLLVRQRSHDSATADTRNGLSVQRTDCLALRGHRTNAIAAYRSSIAIIDAAFQTSRCG